jgi:hypothetical protein
VIERERINIALGKPQLHNPKRSGGRHKLQRGGAVDLIEVRGYAAGALGFSGQGAAPAAMVFPRYDV